MQKNSPQILRKDLATHGPGIYITLTSYGLDNLRFLFSQLENIPQWEAIHDLRFAQQISNPDDANHRRLIDVKKLLCSLYTIKNLLACAS